MISPDGSHLVLPLISLVEVLVEADAVAHLRRCGKTCPADPRDPMGIWSLGEFPNEVWENHRKFIGTS